MHTFEKSSKKGDYSYQVFYSVGYRDGAGVFHFLFEVEGLSAAASAVHYLNGGGDGAVPPAFMCMT